ncbi:MAG: type II toxin-antitoxin system PemK/MazF family toxin [Acetobacteraceae bacterium]
MNRGDLVTVALQGSHGKPRPALIIQADIMRDTSHVAVLLLTSTVLDAPLLRVPIPTTAGTGLIEQSFAMLDRMTTAPRDRIAGVIGRADDATMLAVGRALVVFLGLA